MGQTICCQVNCLANLFPLAVIATGLGAIPLGSSTAFLDLTGSFIILSTTSYAICFVANFLGGGKYFPKGPFHLGKFGPVINVIAVLLIALFNIFFCFRESSLTSVSLSRISPWVGALY